MAQLLYAALERRNENIDSEIEDLPGLMRSGLMSDLPKRDPSVNYYDLYCKMSLANLIVEQEIKKLADKNAILKQRISAFEDESAASLEMR